MKTSARRVRVARLVVHATTGVAPSEYGGNLYLQLRAPDAARSLVNERLLAAATYRAAATVEERIGEASTCAVCVDATEGRIHLEFAERAPLAELERARGVLEAVMAVVNQLGQV